MNLEILDLKVPPIHRGFYMLLALLGGLTLAAGLFFSPPRTWGNLLILGFALTGAGLAGTLFVAIHYATGAMWSVAIRRVPEALAALLPAGICVMALVLVFGHSIYPWTQGAQGHTAAFREWWLRLPFFLLRALIYVLLWGGFAWTLLKNSQRQDADKSLRRTRQNTRCSALFIPCFAVTFFLASVDWIMSLEPGWYSTMFGVYNFAGMFESGLALTVIVLAWLQARGPLRGLVTAEHFHDLGKLLFTFSVFWMYIWFCQYMLIWYANFPEEAVYFTRRLHGAWEPLFIANIVLNWAIPFFVLLPAGTKRNPAVLSKVAAAVLLGRWLDVYLCVMPSIAGGTPVFGGWEIGAILAAVGVTALLVVRGLKRAYVIPIGDPLLTDSLHHHQ